MRIKLHALTGCPETPLALCMHVRTAGTARRHGGYECVIVLNSVKRGGRFEECTGGMEARGESSPASEDEAPPEDRISVSHC